MDRYEEALVKARAEYEKARKPGYTWLMDLLEGMFPELKESEDEKIRKWIIDELKDSLHEIETMYSGDYDNRDEQDKERQEYLNKALAWLEKQKVQKFTEKQDYSDLTDLERAIHRGFLVVGVENVPVTIIKETAQDCLAWMKPAEWSEKDERMRNQLVYDVEQHKKEGLISAKQNKATKALYNGIEKCYD